MSWELDQPWYTRCREYCRNMDMGEWLAICDCFSTDWVCEQWWFAYHLTDSIELGVRPINHFKTRRWNDWTESWQWW